MMVIEGVPEAGAIGELEIVVWPPAGFGGSHDHWIETEVPSKLLQGFAGIAGIEDEALYFGEVMAGRPIAFLVETGIFFEALGDVLANVLRDPGRAIEARAPEGYVTNIDVAIAPTSPAADDPELPGQLNVHPAGNSRVEVQIALGVTLHDRDIAEVDTGLGAKAAETVPGSPPIIEGPESAVFGFPGFTATVGPFLPMCWGPILSTRPFAPGEGHKTIRTHGLHDIAKLALRPKCGFPVMLRINFFRDFPLPALAISIGHAGQGRKVDFPSCNLETPREEALNLENHVPILRGDPARDGRTKPTRKVFTPPPGGRGKSGNREVIR